MENKLIEIKKYIYRSAVGFENKIKYGKNGPEFGELIYINPQEHDTYLSFKHRSFSGRILEGDWDLQAQQGIEKNIIYQACIEHWEYDVPWEETGIYDFMINKIEKFGGFVDGCGNLKDVIIRYEKLDNLFQVIKSSRTFKTQKELNPKSFNENGGLLFHIGRDGKPIFGGGGMHRFSMAKILKLRNIPAQIGVIHPDAIEVWKKHKGLGI
ncbi:hypothetical protein [Christiangramia portivictoriae]|uniref:hypothetical protein n=1 Tax=Christiangramia portivictoriae TaxID=326069 RepID=UPI000410F5F6|nr:hypothetical protein [Christiangramia portivictoriae]